MPITDNVGGVLHTLDTIHGNDGGVLHELATVHSNDDGVLHEIHSAWKAPSTITWSGEDSSTISNLKPSNNGYSCEITTHTLTSDTSVLSITANMSIKGSTKVGFTYEEAYWNSGPSGLDAQYWTSISAKNNTTGSTISILSGAPGPDKTETQYGVLPTGDYTISMGIQVRGIGTKLRTLKISVEKAS